MTPMPPSLGPALLFCPGDRPERFDKALAAADVAVLDLEDGVAATAKAQARELVANYLLARGPNRLAVRINNPASAEGQADAVAVHTAGVKLLLLPKTQGTEELDALAEIADCAFIASIETARGLLAVDRIVAHPRVVAVSWGPYDLAADLGLRAVRAAAGDLLPPLVHARNSLVFAAAAARKIALDTVTSELNDPAVVERDAGDGALLGFRGKFAIHPAQVPVIRNAYLPRQSEVERSRRMLAAAAGQGAFLFEGEMVDEPMLRRARLIIGAAEAADAREAP
ncbi:CoA ester lyase [Xanthobacter autotrophicus DSM 431]|uniref:HpcH/HpaI aldolase/citrate lyase family protein n=1 Tax=Xanthobacter nonsaccharivorans TaxID=3119912 RepID=UPI003729D0E2